VRVLHIDGDKLLVGIVRRDLSRCGFTVDTVSRVEDGLSAMACVQYDAVVLELGQGEHSRLQFIRHLRRQKDYVPIIVLSCRRDAACRVEALNFGAD
jgi:two-component system, OmpR family, response regulator QseB